MKMTMRTDLAMEIKERFDRDQVEIQGVILEKTKEEEGILVTTVEIQTEEGAIQMGKPKGVYVTIEDSMLLQGGKEHEAILKKILTAEIKRISQKGKRENNNVLVVGLGNREVTLDSLGPRVLEHLFVTRHLIENFGEEFALKNGLGKVSALAPGVMAQTGMETGEVIQGVCSKLEPDLVIVIDALAASSKERLASSLQVTDTGIAPGSGVGNDRKVLDEETLGARVIAIGVPMVMDMEDSRFFVTPRNLEEAVGFLAECIGECLNGCFHHKVFVSGI